MLTVCALLLFSRFHFPFNVFSDFSEGLSNDTKKDSIGAGGEMDAFFSYLINTFINNSLTIGNGSLVANNSHDVFEIAIDMQQETSMRRNPTTADDYGNGAADDVIILDNESGEF